MEKPLGLEACPICDKVKRCNTWLRWTAEHPESTEGVSDAYEPSLGGVDVDALPSIGEDDVDRSCVVLCSDCLKGLYKYAHINT